MRCEGSKARVSNDIAEVLQGYIMRYNIGTYIEPFVGGCNVIDKVQCSRKIGIDTNEYIISLYKHIQQGGELPEDIQIEEYCDCKAHYKKRDKRYEKWYLGAVGYLGGTTERLYGGGYGNYKEQLRLFKEQQRYIQDIEFRLGDYRDEMEREEMEREEMKREGVLIYCDAPYEHSKNIPRNFRHEDYWEWVREESIKNIVVVSEVVAPADFIEIWSEGDKERSEKLFMYSKGKYIEDIKDALIGECWDF